MMSGRASTVWSDCSSLVARRSIAVCGLLLLLCGCQAPMMDAPIGAISAGDYGAARLAVREGMVKDREDRRYLLDRMSLGILTLADGYPDSAQSVFDQIYGILRTQGINADKTVASVVLNEDIKFWKGEPFEQALAMLYYSAVQAELGSWDNARAAAKNALFYLRDFGEDEQGERLDTHEIARRSLVYERAIDAGDDPDEARRKADYLDHGYVVRESDFTLGYLLAGIANQQLGRRDEASDNFGRTVEIDPDLDPLVAAFGRGRYNTVLLVSFGLGPRKEGYGPDRSLARFTPRFASDTAALRVRIGDRAARSYPQVLDVNSMAADHMWNNLEDVRAAKSTIGSVFLTGGAIATDVGIANDSDAALAAGIGAMVAGIVLKAGAHADTRYCPVMPQRFYAVPLLLPDEGAKIELEVKGIRSSRLVLTGLGPPRGRGAQLRYVRLVSQPMDRDIPAPRWATSGEIFYANAHLRTVPGPAYPYLMGGRCVRPPSEAVLSDYQRSGYLRGSTLSGLRDLYSRAHVALTVQDQDGYAGRHLLEGGNSLVCPLPGTTGFARVFGQEHPAYGGGDETVVSLDRLSLGE